MVRKLSAPGPRELPAPNIDEADESGFISLESLKQGLTMRMPAFSGTPGMRLNMVLSSAAGMVGEQVIIEDPDAEIVVSIPPSDALRFVDQAQVGVYAVYHGDPVEISPTALFSTGADVYTPTIDEAVGNVIPVTVEQATVRIRSFENMAEGDRIELYIFGSAPNSAERVILVVEAGDVGRDITFALSTQAYRRTTLYIAYEVRQGGRVLTPRASTFAVEGPIAPPPVRPVYLLRESEVTPNYVDWVYEGEEHCMPFEVTIPDDASPGDRLTLFAIPSFGKAILDHHVVDGTEGGHARMCLTAERVMEGNNPWHLGCLLENSSGPGRTTSSPVISCEFIERYHARNSRRLSIHS